MARSPKEHPPYRWEPFRRAYERTHYPFPTGRTEAEYYSYAMTFLDQLVKRASERGLPKPSNRLEAQTIVWWRETEAEDEERFPQLPNLRLQALASKLSFDVGFLETIDELLTDKKQVIFQGPPGTGKTYVARELANHLAGIERSCDYCAVPPVLRLRRLCAGLSSDAEGWTTRVRVEGRPPPAGRQARAARRREGCEAFSS